MNADLKAAAQQAFNLLDRLPINEGYHDETVEVLDALRAGLAAQAPAEGDEALAERLRDAYHSKTRIGHPMWKNLDTDRKEPWLAVARAARPNVQPKGTCNPHPKAPHGFSRNASHNVGRYVCVCEEWDAWDAGYQEGVRAALDVDDTQAPAPAPDHVPVSAEHEAETDAKLGLKLLPPIRVDLATFEALDMAAFTSGKIIQAVVRERLEAPAVGDAE